MPKSPRRTHSTSCNARGATSAASDQLIVSSDEAGNKDDDGDDYDDDDTDRDDNDYDDDVMMIFISGIVPVQFAFVFQTAAASDIFCLLVLMLV